MPPLRDSGSTGTSDRGQGEGGARWRCRCQIEAELYDPGGPVLLADTVDPGVQLAALAGGAARLGAVLIVLPTPPGDRREEQLRRIGWTVASQWYLGRPSTTPQL